LTLIPKSSCGDIALFEIKYYSFCKSLGDRIQETGDRIKHKKFPPPLAPPTRGGEVRVKLPLQICPLPWWEGLGEGETGKLAPEISVMGLSVK
jgi:hypothetical protein